MGQISNRLPLRNRRVTGASQYNLFLQWVAQRRQHSKVCEVEFHHAVKTNVVIKHT